jgi:hypothetical protein
MTAQQIADTLDDITHDRPTVFGSPTPGMGTTQRLVGLLTSLNNQLDRLRTEVGPARVGEVEDCYEDLSAARLAVGRLRVRLNNLRGAA